MRPMREFDAIMIVGTMQGGARQVALWSKTYYPLLTVMMVGKRREEIYSDSLFA